MGSYCRHGNSTIDGFVYLKKNVERLHYNLFPSSSTPSIYLPTIFLLVPQHIYIQEAVAALPQQIHTNSCFNCLAHSETFYF